VRKNRFELAFFKKEYILEVLKESHLENPLLFYSFRVPRETNLDIFTSFGPGI